MRAHGVRDATGGSSGATARMPAASLAAAILEHSPVPMALFAATGRLSWFNAAFVERVVRGRLPGAPDPTLEDACPVPDVRRRAHAVLRGGEPLAAEFSSPAGGRIASWRVVLSRVPASGAPLLLASYAETGVARGERDGGSASGPRRALATSRAQPLDGRPAAARDPENLGALQEQLVAVVGHDLRTPLSAITLATALLTTGAALDASQARAVERIRNSADRMKRIISDLLDFTRARRAGGIPVEKQRIDLAEVATRAVAELQSVYRARSISLTVDGDAHLAGDAARLTQVVSNLVGNALQHSPPDADVAVTVGREGCETVLTVGNGGPPIPAPSLPILFEPFERASSQPANGSVGLGLFIVREIVRAHGGTVTVRSTADEGTMFVVRLPA